VNLPISTGLSEAGRSPGYAAIGLHRPKVLRNVGGVLRAAYAFGAAMVAVAGARYKVQSTDTGNAYLHLPLLQVDDLRAIIPFDCIPVAVERRADAIPLPVYHHPERAFYVFGPEDGDLGARVFEWCRDIVVIPSHDSLNLAAAVNIVLYDRLAKQSR
jgi:tRNA(Leu) C34 or U34 (ribose-2'-O)-methylase TrmL